jgi:Zn-dependent peptidase ImmA (M78 family)
LGRQERIQAYRYAQLLYEITDHMARRVNSLPIRIPESKPEPIHAARITRSELGLSPDRPIGNLVNVLEKGGALILALPILLEGRDAFSAWVGHERLLPVIFLSGGKTGDRLRFNIAHELAHLVMHRARREDGKELEIQAHQFAAELLMPEEGIRTDLVPPLTLTSIAPLKPKWGVSIQALVKRAKDLEIISHRQYKYLFEQMGAKGWRVQEPLHLSVPIEKPRAFKKMAELVYNRPIDIKNFSEDVKLTSTFLRELLNAHADIGQTPNEPVKDSPRILSFSKR